MVSPRFLLLAAAAATLASSLGAHGAGTISERREVSGFDRVVLRAVGELQIEQGDREGLVVEAEPRVLPKIETVVKSGTLYIDVTGSFSTQEPLRYRLSVKRLHGIASEASGRIAIGRLQTDELDAAMAGSGTLRIARVEARTIRVRVSGAANVSAAGTVNDQSIVIEGAGEYEAERLTSERARALVSDSGSARLSASEELVADVSGSGAVAYVGNPRVTQKITGAGSVRRAAR